MKTMELTFERPADRVAHEPPEIRGRGRDDVRLLVTVGGEHRHARFEDLPHFLRAGDLLVVNESEAIPASLPAKSRLGDILLNLSTRFRDDLYVAEPRWSAGKPGPLPLAAGDELRVGPANVRLVGEYPGIPRLWLVHLDRPAQALVREFGHPIHYAYTDEWPMDTYRTIFSRVPGSAEMPSAGRAFTPGVRETIEEAGVRIAPIVLHTGGLESRNREPDGRGAGHVSGTVHGLT